MKILSPQAILSEKWGILTWSHIGPKFNLHHLYTESIHGIKDDHANSKIGYSHGTTV